MDILEKALEARARRAAKAVGLYARKGRKRCWQLDDQGGFMLIDPDRNLCLYGQQFDLDAEDVIEICAALEH